MWLAFVADNVFLLDSAGLDWLQTCFLYLILRAAGSRNQGTWASIFKAVAYLPPLILFYLFLIFYYFFIIFV